MKGVVTHEQSGPAPGGSAAPSVGQLIKRYRSLAGLTQEELAERSGYSTNYISKLERNERVPPLAALGCLATTLELGEGERTLLLSARENRATGAAAHRLVGRQLEMAEIRQHLAGLGPPVLLFSGEPGIGKTRLLDEAVASAAQNGWRVVRGGCQRRAADLYAPLSGAVADALASLSASDRQEVIRQAGPLDLLLPELVLAGHRPAANERILEWTNAAVTSEQRGRLLLAAVERCLRAVAGEAGAVLVLDDLQWAGPDVFDLLLAVMRPARSPWVRLIGAYRDSEAATDSRLPDFVGDLAREARVQVLSLEPLSEMESEQLVAERMPTGIEDPSVVPAIVRRAGGVPFFLISYLESCRPGEKGNAQPTLPWTVAQVVRQRVLSLPEITRELLGVAATIGREVSHAVLVRVANRSDEEVVDALETAVDARLLVEDAQPGYHFTHDLIRESIEADISGARRRLLHRRIGAALERDPRSSAESLAFHFAQGDEDDKAITYLDRAGDQAQQRVAHAAAATLFQQAIDRLERVDRHQDAVPIYEKLGVALYRAGRHEEAIAALDRARIGWRAAGDPAGEARVALRLVDTHFRLGTREGEVDQLLNLAQVLNLADSGPQPDPMGISDGDLLRLEGVARLMYANPAGGRMVAVGQSLTRLGRTVGSPRLQTVGMRVHGSGLLYLGRVADGAALIEKTMPGDPIPENDTRVGEIALMLSLAYLSMGALERSQALSQRMLALAESAGDEGVAGQHTVVLACGHYVRGDWRRGRELLRKPLDGALTASPSPSLVRLTPLITRTLIWAGDWQVARPYLETCLREARSMGIDNIEQAALLDLAELDLLEGCPQVAITRVESMNAIEAGWDLGALLFSTLAGAYVELEEREPAQRYAQRALAEARRTGSWVNGLRALEICGVVEARWGNPRRARALFDEGVQRARAMPFPYAEARLLYACSRLDDQEGDRALGETRAAAALEIFTALGAPIPSRTQS
jgi:transcriptional regulator with XRE-family HTH domain/tetratricopeptide (TPR) repeat protein